MKEQKPRKNMKKGKKFIPEPELVAKLYDELIENYGYNPAQIKTDYRISGLKMEKVVADIAIFKEDTNELETIIEVHSSIRPMEDNSIDYFFEVFAESKAEYGMFYNGFKKTCFKKILNDQIIETDNIPSKQKIKKVEKVNVKLKFWKILEHLRTTVPSYQYKKITTALLYLKFYDEKNNNFDNFFKNITNDADYNSKLLHKINNSDLPIGKDFEHNFAASLLELKPKLLSLLLFEMQNFNIKSTNPEIIAHEFFERFERNMPDNSTMPKSIFNLMYKYTINKSNNDSIQNSNLLSAYSAMENNFDLIDLSVDHLHLTGEKLKDYFENNITIINYLNQQEMSTLELLFKIKNILPELLTIGYDGYNESKKFQSIIATPPWGLIEKGGSHHETNLIINLIENLKPGGRLAVTIIPSLLTLSRLREFREFLRKNTTIHGIIHLPQNTVKATTIRPIILLLENSKPTQAYNIFMSDLDFKIKRNEQINPKITDDVFEEFLKVQYDEKDIEQNEYSFYVSSSILNEENWSIQSKTPLMQKLADPKNKNIQFVKKGKISGNAKLIFPKDKKLPGKNKIEVSRITVSDITNGVIKSDLTKKSYLELTDELDESIVKENDILVSIMLSVGKIAIVTEEHDGAHVGSEFLIIRPDSDKDKEYFFNNLNSAIFQKQLKKISSSWGISRVRKSDLEKIYFVPIDDKKMKKINKLREEIRLAKQITEKKELELNKILGDEDEF
jgi:type I restriction-modification system DNA methylase subunit